MSLCLYLCVLWFAVVFSILYKMFTFSYCWTNTVSFLFALPIPWHHCIPHHLLLTNILSFHTCWNPLLPHPHTTPHHYTTQHNTMFYLTTLYPSLIKSPYNPSTPHHNRSHRRTNMRHVWVQDSPLSGQLLKQPTTLSSPSRVMCGPSVSFSLNSSPMAASHILVSAFFLLFFLCWFDCNLGVFKSMI